MDRIQKHAELCKELNDTYAKKNHDYGNSFGETFDKLGIISAVTRISDKYNRLVSLCTKSEEERKVKDESITDTLLDMANYCIMTVIEMHKNDTIEKCESDEKCEHNWVMDNTAIDSYDVIHHYTCSKCGAKDTKSLGI